MAKCQTQSVEYPTHVLLLYFLLISHFQALLRYLFAQLGYTFIQSLRSWRAARHIDVYRHNGINALDGVATIVKFSTCVRTLAHTQDPLWLCHLLPEQTHAQ